MLLMELNATKGTYSGVRFNNSTIKLILKYIKDNHIPNGVSEDKLHTTLLYSRKFLPNYIPKGKYSKDLVGTPTTFDVWKSDNNDNTSTNCLVLKYDCADLIARHKLLMDEHGATYDFSKYEPHITLSYDIGDFVVSNLPDILKTLPHIHIISEYKEDLDLSWAKNKGCK